MYKTSSKWHDIKLPIFFLLTPFKFICELCKCNYYIKTALDVIISRSLIVGFSSPLYKIKTKEYGDSSSIRFDISCIGKCLNKLLLLDEVYNDKSEELPLKLKQNLSITRNLLLSHNWYDFKLLEYNNNNKIIFSRHFMGHIENGYDSITDPAMSISNVDNNVNEHPNLDFYFNKIKTFYNKIKQCKNNWQYGFTKDKCWK